MIRLERLTKRYGTVKAVERVSFEVGRGEIVGLLGPNGAGKTTTMRMLTTYLPPTSGRAALAGHDVLDEPLEVRRRVGYLPESVPLYTEMRVREYLTFRSKLKDVPRARRRAAIDEVIARCQLGEVENRVLGHLSKGFRQRVGLAEAMVHDPDILILDEPTAGLDPIQIREVRALIRELGDRHTILLSTHIMSEVEAVCGRVIIIARGRIAEDQPLDRLQSESAIILEARGPADAIRNALQSAPGVERVDGLRSGGGVRRVRGPGARRRRHPRGARPARRPERLAAPPARPEAHDPGRPIRPGRRPGDPERRRRTRGRLTMRHVPTLLRRELGAYFLAPMAFLILLAFQVMAWLNFWQLVDALSRPQQYVSGRFEPLNTYISGSVPFWIALLVAVPALTMRLIAEERRSGTIETLLTVPVTEAEVVVSKWLAGVVMYLALLLPFFIYLPFLYYQGRYKFDTGPVAALAIGLTTLGMMFVAIGVFFSAQTRNQIIAAIWTFVVLFLVVVLTMLASNYAAERQAAWAEGLRFVAPLYQVQEFGAGKLDLRYLTLHLSVTAFMLYLTVKTLESRKAA